MNLEKLNKSKKKLLSIEDISNILSINKESAKVTANRYVNNGSLLRIKRNFYITPTNLEQLKESDLFQLANIIQVPSYISLNSALSYYNISTQQLRGVIESVALKRTKSLYVNKNQFKYILVKKSFYNGFIPENNFFIAVPEKALADAIYLSSMGRYNTDFDAIDFNKINESKVSKYIKNTNNRSKSFWDNLCKHYRI